MERKPDVDPSKNTSNTGSSTGGMTQDQKELLKIGEISAEIKHERQRIAGLKRRLRMENFRRRIKGKGAITTDDAVGNFFAALISSTTTPSEHMAARRQLQRSRSTNGTAF